MLQKKRRVERPTRRLTNSMKAKTMFIVGFLSLALVGLIGRLFYVQVIQQDFWQQKAVAQQLSDVEIAANRGQIYDANMSVLALTREVYTIVMAPENIHQETTRQTIADELSVMLDVDRDTLYKQTQDKELLDMAIAAFEGFLSDCTWPGLNEQNIHDLT